MKILITFTLLITNIIWITSFRNPSVFINRHTYKCHNDILSEGCAERTIYRNYLVSLRKTRRLLNSTASLVNFTNEFVTNNSIQTLQQIQTKADITIKDNTRAGAKNILMGNIVLDVSDIKQIHIRTKKDKIIIELDKKSIIPTIINDISNMDSFINTLSLITKILNMS